MMGGSLHLSDCESTACTLAYIFDSVQEEWKQVESMKTARYDHGCTLLPDGRVLATGGNGEDRKRLKSTELFSLSSGTWTSGPELPLELSLFAMETIGAETYLIGGSTNREPWWGSDIIYHLGQDSLSWIEAGRISSPKYFIGALPINIDDCSNLAA